MSKTNYCQVCGGPILKGIECKKCNVGENKNKSNKNKEEDYPDPICKFSYGGKRCPLPNSDIGQTNRCRWHRAVIENYPACCTIVDDARANPKKYLDTLKRESDKIVDKLSDKFIAEAKAEGISNHELFRRMCLRDYKFNKVAKYIGVK